MSKLFLVVNADDRVVGVYSIETQAHKSTLSGDIVAEVTNKDLESGECPLFYLPKLAATQSAGELGSVSDVVEEHGTEIDELFQRISSLEEDVYGEARPIIHVELEPDKKEGMN